MWMRGETPWHEAAVNINTQYTALCLGMKSHLHIRLMNVLKADVPRSVEAH